MADGFARFLFDAASALILLAVALGGAYLPRYLAIKGRAAGKGRSLTFQLGNMLSAGVMLSACFCHLLAEALEEIEEAVPDFPLAPFLCAFGYLLTLTADQYATRASNSTHHHHNGPSTLLKPNHKRSDGFQTVDSDETANKTAVPHSEEFSQECCVAQSLEIETAEDEEMETPRVSFLTALFLGMALSLHSVLEGLALGAQETINASKDILIAIAAHKGLAAYALGASLVDSRTSKGRFWKVIIGFATASPIGILVGYGFSEIGSGVVGAALSALASGTFLYVAMMEIIPMELEDSEHLTSKLAIMFLGFGAMSVLAIWA